MSSSHLPALDPVRLRALRDLAGDDMPDLPREVAQIFLDTAAEDLRMLAEAFRGSDKGRVSELAHRMRGSSANIGATTLQWLCEVVERGDAAPEDMNRLSVEFERVQVALCDEFEIEPTEAESKGRRAA